MKPLALNSVLFDNDARTPHHFTRIALPVDLAQSSPGTKDFSISDLDQVDFMLGTESLDELDVFGLRACFDEDAQVRLALV